MDLKGKIKELVNANLGKNEFFLVEIHISANPGMRKITVLVDGDKGITVEDCALISRKLAEAIELENLIDSAYLLEVSSPGIDFPLQSPRQYSKNIGRRVSVTLNDQKVKVGKLEEIKDKGIVIQEEQKEGGKGKKIKLVTVEIQFSDIKKCNVLIAF